MARIEIENARVTDKGAELKTSQAGKEYATFTVMWSDSRKDRTGQWENGPTKFVRCNVFGAKVKDVAYSLIPGTRVNVSGNIEHFEWQSDNGPRDSWTIPFACVSLPVPKAEQPGGYPWGGQPQQGGDNAQPPF